jgi:threonyl-tRNA synthetase
LSENLIGYLDDQGNILDTQSAGENCTATPIEYDNSEAALEIVRHSTAHLMAQAITELYPNAQFFVGPVVDEGFYYDFRVDVQIGENDLKTIEKKMKELIKKKYKIEKYELSKAEALEKFAKDDLKLKVMERITDDTLSIYKQGDWLDLCRGPHVPSTNLLNAFKLTKVAGAYWRGDSSNKMLQRIYGTAWADKKSLNHYLEQLKQAKKRDHRRIGKDLDLFSIQGEAGGGLVFWHPNGSKIRQVIEDYWRTKHLEAEYELLYTPHIALDTLWQTSGHTDYYQESMYKPIEDENKLYRLKPMNCPFHVLIYKNQLRSYRDLPIRWAELGTVYRHEMTGALHGLMRVRGFTQDDAHIFCTEDQVETEITNILNLTIEILHAFTFDQYEIQD